MDGLNPFIQSQKHRRNYILLLLEIIGIFLAACVFVYMFILLPVQVNGISMEPTFSPGDILLANRLPYWLGNTTLGRSLNLDYKRGDVIVFFSIEHPDKEFIKRIVGLPGDKIYLKNGKIFVNDKLLEEKYLPFGQTTNSGDLLIESGPSLIVPDDSFFVIGDNRLNSLDSRSSIIGFIQRKQIKGIVILRIYPFEKFGSI